MSSYRLPFAATAASLGLAALTLSAPGSADSGQTQREGEVMAAQERFDQSYALSPGAEVSVEGIAGPVTIVTGSGARAEVQVVRMAATQRELDCYRTAVEASRDRLRIRHVQEDTPGCRSIRSRQEVSLALPRSANVALETIAGRVEVGALDGHLSLDSIAGQVSLASIRSASLSSLAGGLSLHVDRLAPRGVDISSVVGGVELGFGRDADADVSVSSVMGSVRSESPALRLYGEDQSYRARVGRGGPNVTMSSIVGRVRLRSN